MGQRRTRKRISEDHHSIRIEGREIPLIVRRHPRARRMILRLNATGEGAVVTIPPHADPADGLDMARRQSAWLRSRLDDIGQHTPFSDGASIPFHGRDLTVRHRPDARGTAWLEEGEIHVAGALEHLSRRLGDWLRKQARADISPLAHAKAAIIDQTVSRITIRDTRTRWGSCSCKGGLSFSWRLVMAPPGVLDYVVAHEVAHLAHMNHSAAFWDTVHCISGHVEEGRDWLRTQGSALHRVGS